MVYSYYDYLEKYYEDYYAYYYEYYYWPYYYGNVNGSHPYNGTYPPSPYIYVPTHNYDYDFAGYFIYVFSWICLIISCAVFGLAMYQIYINYRYGTIHTNKVLLFLIIMCLFTHLLTNILDTIFEHYWWMDYIGWTKFEKVWQSWNALVSIAKTFLYLVYIYRFYIIWDITAISNPNYKRERLQIIIFYTTLIIIQIGLNIIWILVGIPDLQQDSEMWQTIGEVTNICWAIIDLFFFASIAYIVIKSILSLIVKTDKAKTKTTITIEPVSNNSNVTKTEQELQDYMANNNEVEITKTSTKEPTKDSTKVSVASTSEGIKTSRYSSSAHNQQAEMIHTTVKIGLLCAIASLSSFWYDFTFPFAHHMADVHKNWKGLTWVVWTWAFDVVVNMICVYLSMGISYNHYKLICYDYLKCHQCCLKCIIRITPKEIETIVQGHELKVKT